jgi:hypothetical protein
VFVTLPSHIDREQITKNIEEQKAVAKDKRAVAARARKTKGRKKKGQKEGEAEDEAGSGSKSEESESEENLDPAKKAEIIVCHNSILKNFAYLVV